MVEMRDNFMSCLWGVVSLVSELDMAQSGFPYLCPYT